jgi:tetratricopeptide (TPR) repeat protein
MLLFGILQTLFALRYATADVEVLFLPVVVASSLLIGVGWSRWIKHESRLSRFVATLVALVMVSAGLSYGWPRNNLSQRRAASDYASQMLRQLPPNATAFVQGDDAFLLAYYTRTLGERPDVTLFDRQGLILEDELDRPGPARLNGETTVDWRLRRELALLGQALQQRSGSTLYFMSWPGYELPVDGLFVPDGLWWHVARRPVEPASSQSLEPADWESLADEASKLDDDFARSVAAVYPFMRGEREAFFQGGAAAEIWFDMALRLDPAGEATLNALGTSYGRRGRYAEAVVIFEQLTAAHPASVRGWANLAIARRLAGDLQGASEAQARVERLAG